MKFGLIMATRGSPHRAIAVIESARFMASGKHDIKFAVALDEDDFASIHTLKAYRSDVLLSIAARPPGIPECWNRCVPLMDCDAYMALADDGFVVTDNWDERCAEFIERFPKRELTAFAWSDSANPGQPTVLMASREWLGLTGEFMDPRFPFWFSDTAFGETWSFVTGRHMPICGDLQIASRPNRFNPRLRDLSFWWDFYAWTRNDRLAKAAEIRRKLGLTLSDATLKEIVRQWGVRDSIGRKAQIPEDTRPPSSEYLVAKANAQAAMKVAA